MNDIDTSILDNIGLYVGMECGDGKIYMNKNQYDVLLLISKDEKVSFIGRFDQQPTPGFFDSADFVLNDGQLAG